MARVLHAIEKGLRIYAENSQTVYVDHLFGAGAPAGTSGETAAAPVGSLYSNTSNGGIWKKIASTNSAADWSELGDVTIDELNWRNELVRAATNDTVSAGVVDPTAFSDNDSGLDGNDFSVNEYLIGDVNGAPALFIVTVVTSATSITVAAAGLPIVSGDTFVVQSYLPDAGADQEAQAILHIPAAGSPGIKIGDFNWAIATGINLSGAYAAASGNVVSGDTVEGAIAKLDGVNDNQDSLLGMAQGSTNLGTFTGATIPDSSTVKGALQSLETAHEEVDQNVNDLISLSGVAENSTNFGAFSAVGDFLLGATETAKSALQKLADYLFGIKVTQTVGVTTITAVDSVAHATYKYVTWYVEVFVTGTPANREAFIISALTDGTNIDDTKFAKLDLGANIAGLAASVAINGANMELRIVSTPSVTVNVRRITVV